MDETLLKMVTLGVRGIYVDILTNRSAIRSLNKVSKWLMLYAAGASYAWYRSAKKQKAKFKLLSDEIDQLKTTVNELRQAQSSEQKETEDDAGLFDDIKEI